MGATQLNEPKLHGLTFPKSSADSSICISVLIDTLTPAARELIWIQLIMILVTPTVMPSGGTVPASASPGRLSSVITALFRDCDTRSTRRSSRNKRPKTT